MGPSALALLGYATWMLLLVAVIAALRSSLTLSGARPANSFSPAGDDVSAFSGRLCRAHANCYEFFPIFGGVLAVALFTQRTGVTDPLALWALAARVVQSSIHLVSTSTAAVTARFAFFLIQFLIMVYWAVRLWGVGA